MSTTHCPCEVSVGVIGIGNCLMCDEGLGVHAVRQLAREHDDADVLFVDGGTDPWSALTAVRNCRSLVVLDAVMGGKEPGMVHRLPLDEVDGADCVMSLHGLTLYHLLQYERLLGNTYAEILVVGMEPERIEPGLELSATCRQRLEDVLAAARCSIGDVRRQATAKRGVE